MAEDVADGRSAAYFVESAFSAARRSGPALIGSPVACFIHKSGRTDPYFAIRSNSGPSLPFFCTCSSIWNAMKCPSG